MKVCCESVMEICMGGDRDLNDFRDVDSVAHPETKLISISD